MPSLKCLILTLAKKTPMLLSFSAMAEWQAAQHFDCTGHHKTGKYEWNRPEKNNN